jgi:hypothetical protein
MPEGSGRSGYDPWAQRSSAAGLAPSGYAIVAIDAITADSGINSHNMGRVVHL